MRLGGEFMQLERHLLRNFRKYAHRSVVEKDSIWHWLSVAKHYGLPTRLMDWTYSPYVALHFATDAIELFGEDGVIWAVNYVNIHERAPELFKQALTHEGAHVFTVDMIAHAVHDLEHLETLSQDPFVLFFEPPSIDDRIVNQFALFTLSSSSNFTLDPWLEKHPDAYRKIIIPTSLKWEIRDKLDQANISERVLFPGLDGLSKYLKRQYSPKN
jgi:hypothetical protein